MKIELEIFDCYELEVVTQALAQVQAKRDGRYKATCAVAGIKADDATLRVTPAKTSVAALPAAPARALQTLAALAAAEDVPAVPIAQAIEEARAETTPPAATATTQQVMDAIANAQKKGLQPLTIITPLLNGKRVSETSGEHRLELVQALKKAVAEKEASA